MVIRAFDVVIDKGALDALYSDETDKTKQDVAQLFKEVSHRFPIVSFKFPPSNELSI